MGRVGCASLIRPTLISGPAILMSVLMSVLMIMLMSVLMIILMKTLITILIIAPSSPPRHHHPGITTPSSPPLHHKPFTTTPSPPPRMSHDPTSCNPTHLSPPLDPILDTPIPLLDIPSLSPPLRPRWTPNRPSRCARTACLRSHLSSTSRRPPSSSSRS